MTPKAPDYGHHEADKELFALIRRLHLSYRQARIGLQDKIEKYLDEFEKEDAEKRALYDSGELSHEDFVKWRQKMITDTRAWRDMLEQLSDDMTHQNEIAASMIDDTLPGVYALNHNYGTYEAEKGSGYDTTYTLYDKNTVKRLLTEHEDLLPRPSVPIEKDKLWNKQHLQSAVLQGILTGEPMGDIAKRFQSVTDMTERAAMRNARTAVTGAENAGRIDSYIRAQNMGIKMKQMWMATLDGRTRDSHAIMDGEQQEVGKKFSNGCRYPGDPQGSPGEVYNCFVGDTKIATDSEIIRSYKHDYSGELVTIKTASGVEFTCTPNHPIFTPIGWVSANTLHKGDDVCITFVGDKHSTRRNPNVNHVFSRIDAIHNLFDVIGRKRISALSVNFHGDIPTSDVEIVTHKRFLKDNRNSVLSEEREKFIFKSTNSLTFRNSHLMKSSRRILVSTFSFMSRLRKALSFFWSRMCHAIVHRFRTISGSNPIFLQSQSNSVSGNIQFSGDGFDRPSCIVFTDNIVDIKISTVSHVPVYNLQTEKNYYFVSSIIPDFSEKYNDIPMVIAHNCRCTTVAIVEGADPYNPNLRPSKYLKDEGLTYEQWKEMHGERFYSKLFKDVETAENTKVSFDRNKIQHSIAGQIIVNNLTKAGVEYRQVNLFENSLSEDEIINRLAGGDKTKGSCMSLALCYAGNKSGMDVVDFRGGSSQDVFANSNTHYYFSDIPDVNAMTKTEQGDSIRPSKKLLKNVEEGKQYIFVTGRHAAIVKKEGEKLQYLELQSELHSGWRDFEYEQTTKWGSYKQTMSDTLKNRFGCAGNNSWSFCSLTDISCFKDNDELRDILGYINTAEDEQKKGISGSIK